MALWYCNSFVLVWFKFLLQENHLLDTEYASCSCIHHNLLIFIGLHRLSEHIHPPRHSSALLTKPFKRSSQASRRHCYVFLVVLIILPPLPSRLFAWVAHLTLQLRFISSVFRHLISVRALVLSSCKTNGERQTTPMSHSWLGWAESSPGLPILLCLKKDATKTVHPVETPEQGTQGCMQLLQTHSLTPLADFSLHGDNKIGLWFEMVLAIL